MDKKKKIADVGNAAKGFIGRSKEKVVNAIDQNEDGKFNTSDVFIVKDAVSGAVKEGAIAVLDRAEETRKQMELKVLQPIFSDSLEDSDFFMSKLIRIAEREKKYIESDVCKGAIGCFSDKGGLRIVTIFSDSIEKFGLNLYPNNDSGFYYINPTDRNSYISLDEYFKYMKTVRINELQRVAQDLGAKYFKVTYKEERSSFTKSGWKINVKANKLGQTDGKHDVSEKKYSAIEVAAELSMAGHAPQEPKLVYLSKDDNVQNLIHLRLTGGEDFHHHKISIEMSNSSGIKKSDAVKIDAALKGFKVTGNATVANEAENESRRYLEYEIDF